METRKAAPVKRYPRMLRIDGAEGLIVTLDCGTNGPHRVRWNGSLINFKPGAQFVGECPHCAAQQAPAKQG